jgi:protease IV
MSAIVSYILRVHPLVIVVALAADLQYAEDPSAGLALPMTPLSGDQDGTATVVNPAGLTFLDGPHLELAATGLRADGIQSAGSGVGLYAASGVRAPFLPRLGFGIAAEKLLPPRDAAAPDPGRPLRLSLAAATDLGPFSLGVAWHHFFETAAATDGLDTWDVGVAARLGAYLALGVVARDVAAPAVAGTPLERRWDAEVTLRPLATDRLELAAGAVFGERREALDPRARLAVRVARGVVVRAEAETRRLFALPSGEDRDWRASLGVELSFGEFGAGVYATVASGPERSGLAGGTAVARWSSERYSSLVSASDRIERLKIGGDLDDRELTAAVLALRRYERDDGVRALFVQLDGISAGWATVEELRDAFARLRARGKKVFAYFVAGGLRDYYLAAAADKVYVDAGGGLRIMGMASSAFYLKDFFDKVGVLAQFEKIEEYKSAPEMFTMDASSPPAREMRAALIDDVYARVVARLAADRRLDEAQVKRIFDEGPYTAAEALTAGLVDAVVEPADVDKLIATELHGTITVGEGPLRERPRSWALPQVAIVYLDGDIVDGKSMRIPFIGQKVSGAETIVQALSSARESSRIVAVVLRVSSPGGSAVASELMAREGFKLRGKKPYIVSIGDIAASGGYFASAPGDLIFAEPSSITGSIGIFTGKFDLSRLLARLGITWETMKRGQHADMESYLRPYTDDERAQIKKKLRYYYLRFVDAVARGRNMKEDEVDAVGRGHVWTGAQGKDRRLVDRFGGLQDALQEAKRRAGLDPDEPVELVLLPKPPSSLIGKLLQLAGASDDDRAPLGGLDLPASLVLQPGAVQARLPFVFVDE